jgi:hypothetical protein
VTFSGLSPKVVICSRAPVVHQDHSLLRLIQYLFKWFHGHYALRMGEVTGSQSDNGCTASELGVYWLEHAGRFPFIWSAELLSKIQTAPCKMHRSLGINNSQPCSPRSVTLLMRSVHRLNSVRAIVHCDVLYQETTSGSGRWNSMATRSDRVEKLRALCCTDDNTL